MTCGRRAGARPFVATAPSRILLCWPSMLVSHSRFALGVFHDLPPYPCRRVRRRQRTLRVPPANADGRPHGTHGCRRSVRAVESVRDEHRPR